MITDFAYPVVYTMIEQMYTNYKAELPGDTTLQLELLKAAAKYKVEPLTRRIEKV